MDYIEIGKLLKRERESALMDKKDVAELAGLLVREITLAENGIFHNEKARAIAQAIGIDITDILPDDNWLRDTIIRVAKGKSK